MSEKSLKRGNVDSILQAGFLHGQGWVVQVGCEITKYVRVTAGGGGHSWGSPAR